MGSLLILRHLVNSLDEELSEEKPLLLSSVQVLRNEKNLAVKKAFIRLIVGMADNGYLTLEGGEKLIMFLMQQSAISDSSIQTYNDAQAKRKVKLHMVVLFLILIFFLIILR